MTRHRRDESGAVLLFAMMFLAVLGVVIGAISTELSAQFRLSTVARERVRAASAAESGVASGIAVLRDDLDAAARMWCRTPVSGEQLLTDTPLLVTELNGATVEVRCRTRRGFLAEAPRADPPRGFAIITTTTGGRPLVLGASPGKREVAGSIYLSGAPPAALGTKLGVTEGAVGALTPPCDPSAAPPPNCVIFEPNDVMPDLRLDEDAPTPADFTPPLLFTTDGDLIDPEDPPDPPADIGCAVLFPGYYGDPFNVVLRAHLPVGYESVDLDFDRYLVSGTYSFDFPGERDVFEEDDFSADTGRYVGGQPSAPGAAVPGIRPCSSDEAARQVVDNDRMTGDGVRFVLGGGALLHVNTSLVLYTGGDVVAEPETCSMATDQPCPHPVSVRTAQPADSGRGWTPSTARSAVFSNLPTTGNNPDPVVLRGALYAPGGAVSLSANNSLRNVPVAQAGVVAGTVLLDGPTGAVVRAWWAPGPRTVEITAVADTGAGGGGGISARSVAIVEVDEVAPTDKIRIRSRRTEIGPG